MPIYDYQCPQCGPFTALRMIALRDEESACPACGTSAERTLLAAPAVPILTEAARHAHATNERSCHEPVSARSSHRHGPGCGCSAPSSGARAGRSDGLKSFGTKRPWMISH